jgi:hypothetical protein
LRRGLKIFYVRRKVTLAFERARTRMRGENKRKKKSKRKRRRRDSNF